MSQYAVKVDNVSKVYKVYKQPVDRLKESIRFPRKIYHTPFHAVSELSISIPVGETIGILGKNGAGKSTLLKMITGVLQPTSGNITVNGKIAALLELGAGFNPEYTGLENIYLNGTLMGYSREQMEERLQDILTFADIGDFIHRPVKTYSSGMFARLAFAVAINVDPDILIVDEALSVGDVAFQAKCYRKFNEFKQKGKTIIFVTHSLETVLRYCTHAFVIHDGRMIAEGSPKDMVDLYKKVLVNLYDIEDDLKINKVEAPVLEGEWKQHFSSQANTIEYGNKEAEIIDYGLFDSAGRPVTKVHSDEDTFVRMRIQFHQSMQDPIFAFTIKDLKGNELAGTNTWFQGIDTGLCEAGTVRSITFAQRMNLQSGYYTLSLGCTGFVGNEDLKVYHRLYDVIAFEAVMFKRIVGVFDIDSQISLDE
ncbi:ABC transporter ATP-binding protein [Paenibacillus xylaniclasticus]|uniref:ABC transporter ATP-binding protein n=1 Tax=Paenibacillus xylaniclasticus TaxID=588083 RepID=UPI000FDC59BE|nr:MULTISPECIES: ABC transporter ATP-binding protein [Paenibacillus]GFN32796.1 ABC transporter ATP-binding protein [Paenibacillus curdlanolyticus]